MEQEEGAGGKVYFSQFFFLQLDAGLLGCCRSVNPIALRSLRGGLELQSLLMSFISQFCGHVAITPCESGCETGRSHCCHFVL